METSNIDLNLQSLKEIKEENPAISHIYMRRDDGAMVDIPLAHAEFTIRNHPFWVVEGGAVPMIELAVPRTEGAPDELPILPPRPSEERDVQKEISETMEDNKGIYGEPGKMSQSTAKADVTVKKVIKPRSKSTKKLI